MTEASFSTTPRDGEYVLVAPRIDKAPVIDGDLNDAAWERTAPASAFWVAGGTGVAEDQTLAWVAFDSTNLYVAWACRDRKLIVNSVPRDDNGVWKQDAVELFVSPERSGATERQFILAASGSIFDRRPGKEFGDHGKAWNPAWESKVKVQPWGFTAEMRIPLAELTDVKKFPLHRGSTWTVKLTRHDRGDFAGVRTSSWTRIGASTSDERAVGKLVFEDRNLLANGDAEIVDAAGKLTDWAVEATNVDLSIAPSTRYRTTGAQSAAVTVRGRRIEGATARVSLGAGTLPGEPVETTYAFTADIKAESEDQTLVAYLVAFQGGQARQINFKHNDGWRKVRTLLTVNPGEALKVPVLQTSPVKGSATKSEGGGVIYIDNARLEIVDALDMRIDPESYCLTGNAVEAYRTRNRRVDGTYTYTESMTDDPSFPHHFLPGTGPGQDYGKYRGWIPFDKGRLTDGLHATAVDWSAFWEGHQGHDFVFDLKQEFIITRIDVMTTWPGQRITHAFLKSPGESIYTLVASAPDHVAFKTMDKTDETMDRTDHRTFNDINQRARWVRIQAEARGPAHFSEIEIWGKPAGKTDSLPKRIPYRQSGGITRVSDPKSLPEPDRPVPPTFPMPQEFTLQGPPVPLKDGLVIHYEPTSSERARITAEVLRDELKLCHGINAVIEPASANRVPAVLIGLASDSPLTAAALKAAGLSITAQSPGPEGYVFASRDGRILIAGSDDRGAFYGTQSLLTMAHANATGGIEVPGATLRDWPAMPLRIIEGRGIPSQNLVRALARFRVRYYTPKVINIAAAAEHDAFAKRYFVSFIPFLDFNSTVLGVDQTLTERPATERLEDVPKDSRRNANVGHPRTWEIYFAELDKWLPKFHGDILYIGMDETHHHAAGSRWNVSPESRALNMSAGPLLAYTLNKIDKKAKQYGKRVLMQDTPFFRDHALSYPGDPDPGWHKAIPHLPKDILFSVWHYNKKWVLDRLGKQYGYDLVYLAAGDRDWRPPATIDPDEDVPPFEFPGYFKGINSYMAESSFTGSKLLEAMWIAWNPKALRPKDPGAIAAIDRYVRLYNNLYLGEPFPPRFAATSDDYIPLNIAPAANRSRIDEQPFDGQGWVDLGPNVDLRALKPGRSVMAGVPFDIIDESRNQARSVVMVHNAMFTDRTLPSSVEIPTPDLKTASLLFLHCLDNAPGWNYLRRRELAGFYFIVFEDGTYSKVELKYGTSIGTWDGQNYHWEYAPAGDNMSHANLAWTGQTTAGLTARLFMSEWVNPKPHLNIQKIILRSTHEPSNMNPMLLAVTSIHPKRAAPASSQTLPSASLLLPPKPVGKPVDLSGGVDESELRYVAPDGTVIHAQALNNSLSERTANAQLANEYRSYVGLVTLDGHQAARTDDLRFDFPKPTSLTGVVVTSRFREQRKAANFPPLVFNLFVDVSADAGKTWKEVGSVLNTIAEEHGPVWIPLPSTPVQYVRLRQTRSPDSADYSGFSRVQFYQAP